MKKSISILMALTVSSMLFLTGSCKDKKGEQTTQSATESTEAKANMGKEYTSAYICPMHCEGSGSDAPGNCPVCGMEYVKNPDHKAEGHHDEMHEDEMHEDEMHEDGMHEDGMHEDSEHNQ